MVTAVFTDNDDYARTYGLWQWDYGQQLRIEGLHLPTAVEIHFALQETGGEAIPRVGTTKDGVTTVTIPDSMLEGNRAAWTAEKAYNIYAWVYLSDKLSGETIKRITMQVKSRPKPKAFEAPGDGEIFREAIEAVNDAAKRAEEAGDKAIAAADEAEKAATQTAEHLEAVQGLAEQVETNADTVAQDKQAVAGMLSQVQQAASDAALSAQAAKLSETAAAQAQTGAETAEDTARQYAEETEADRQAVANDRQAVSQMREAVAADRQAVEQTAAQFGQTSQDALTAIGQAQSTAVGAVKAEGNKQTTAVQEAGTQAVSEVAEAKTTAVEAVTTEGDTQTKRVEDAAAGIIADREQINQNKADIAGLVEGMTDLAPAIHSTASGSVITANDATEGRPFRGLRVFGRTEQVRTEGKNLFDISKFIGSESVINNGDGSLTLNSYTTQEVNKIKDVLPLVKTGDVIYVNAVNGTYVSIGGDIWDVNKNHEFLITEEIMNSGYLFFYGNKDNTVITIKDIMISKEKNAVYEPYTGGKPSPSPEYPQEIVSAGESGNITVEVGGKNLLKPNSYNTYYEFPLKANTVITLMTNGKPSQGGNIKFSATDGSTVWFSIDAGQTRVCRSIGSKDIKGFYDLLSPDDGLEYMFAVGDIKTYTPYVEPQSLTLATPNGLPGVPVAKDGNYTDQNGQQWICDEIDLEREKYVQRMAEKDVLEAIPLLWSGAGKWGNNDGYKTLAFYAYINGANSNENWDAVKNYGICNYAIITSNVFNNSIIGFTLGDYIAFRVPRELLPDWDENNPRNEPWTNWLRKQKEAGNPVIVRYALKTPIERDLTPEEIAAYKALRTYGPTTVVSNDAGAGMEVTYVADTKAYIDKKFKELNQAIVNTQIALL